jgi:hypothetical protein
MFLGLLLAAAAVLPVPCASTTSDCTEWIKPRGTIVACPGVPRVSIREKNENIKRAFVLIMAAIARDQLDVDLAHGAGTRLYRSHAPRPSLSD